MTSIASVWKDQILEGKDLREVRFDSVLLGARAGARRGLPSATLASRFQLAAHVNGGLYVSCIYWPSRL